ncbi:MAG: adenylate/guanylate cyclase domain-containing protein [Candidatus Riflebacteria bacterium]|nr:adenylate/guanylate cyclase domain-containing protein [Candidatus Riflebacteria bacterium]
MKTPQKILMLLYLVFFFLPFFIFCLAKAERTFLNGKEKNESNEKEASAVLEEIQRNSGSIEQFRFLLEDFGKKSIELVKKGPRVVKAYYETKLMKVFPRHDLYFEVFGNVTILQNFSLWKLLRLGSIGKLFKRILANVSNNNLEFFLKMTGVQSFKFSHSSGLGFSGEVAKTFFRYIENPNSFSASDSKILGDRLGEIIPFPKILDELVGNDAVKAGKIFIFNTYNGAFAFYWNKTPNWVLGTVIDLGQKYLNPFQGMRLTIADWRQLRRKKKMEIGFISPNGKKIYFSGEKRKFHFSLSKLVREVKGESDFSSNERRQGSVRTLISPVLFGIPWKAFVIYQPPKILATYDFIEKIGWLFSFLFFSAGVALIVHRAILNRGLRYSVTGVLLTSCFSLVLLPVGGIIGFSKRAVNEIRKNDRDQLEEALKSDLERIDSGERYVFSGLVQRLFSNIKNPKLLQPVIKAKTLGQMEKAMNRIASESTAKLKCSGNWGMTGIYAVSSNKLNGHWTLSKLDSQDSKSAIEAFADLWKSLFIRVNAEEKSAKSSQLMKREGTQLKELKTDSLLDVMDLALGRESLISLLTIQQRPCFIDVSHAGMNFLLLPFREPGAIDNSFLFFYWTNWTELGYAKWLTENPYPLSLSGSRNVKMGSFENREMNDFDVFDKGWRIVPHGINSRKNWNSGLNTVYPQELLKAFERIQTTDIPQSGQDFESPGKPLYEAHLGKNLPLFILGAFRSTKWLDVRTAFLNKSVLLISIFSLLLAVVLAKKGTDHFLQPLTKLSNALKKVESGNFREKLDETRKDEFGELGKVFNSMTKRLEEGKILGSYVSESVLRAIEDSDFQEKAKSGLHREVTVLFSGILEFDEFRTKEKPERILEILDAHLKAFNAALVVSKGDIDKVMGDKILIIFDHEKMGGASQAVEKALWVIGEVKKSLSPFGVELAMGLNSGIVVAGILGAQSDRLIYTVIGDTVNLASRLSTLAYITSGTRVVISGKSLACLERKIPVEKLPFKRVKGKTQEVEAWLLL